MLGRHDDVTDGSLLLSNNFMTDGGKHYAACAAVFAGYVFDTQITQNTITDFSCAPPPPHPPPLPPQRLFRRQQHFGRVGVGRLPVPRVRRDSFRVLNL